NMATMFGFLLTDGPAVKDVKSVLRGIADRSFHRLTVDGDPGPNDTLLFWDSRTQSAQQPSATSEELLARSVLDVSQELCRTIAADGEGATRLITVQVQGAPTEEAAAHVARTIATSPLTKTA